jgi:hypothetical protein
MKSNAECNMIAELDLDPIKVKLMHKESGEGWSLEQANAVEFEYRRFLCLMKLFPHEHTAPLFDVDIFWHYHILDTMKYAADCEQIFGYFLHHFPYAGLRGEDDEAAHLRVGVRMKELYEATFGEAYIRQDEGQAATATAAWSVAASPLTAGTAAAMPKTAWSVAASPLAAGSAAAPKTAWSVAASPLTAGSAATPKTAWSVAASPLAAGLVAATRKTAWSVAAVQNDPFYTVRPVLARAA